MKNRFIDKLTAIYKEKKNRKIIKQIFFSLAAIVVFVTSYFLILPAITAEKDKAKEHNIDLDQPVLDDSLLEDQTDALDLSYIKGLLDEYKELVRKVFVSNDAPEKVEKNKEYYHSTDLDAFEKVIQKTEEMIAGTDLSQEELDKALFDLKHAKEEFDMTKKMGLMEKEERPEEDKTEEEKNGEMEENPTDENPLEKEENLDKDDNPDKKDEIEEKADDKNNEEAGEMFDTTELKVEIENAKHLLEEIFITEETAKDVEKDKEFYSPSDVDLFRNIIIKTEEELQKEDLNQEQYERLVVEFNQAKSIFEFSKKTGSKEELKEFLLLKQEVGDIKGQVNIKNTLLPEKSTVRISPILSEEQEAVGEVSMYKMRSLSEYDMFKEKLDSAFEEELQELYLYDISVFSEEGEYQEVREEAEITLDMTGSELEKDDNSNILVVHFSDDKLVKIEPTVETDGDGKVKELHFNTSGFSVFAVIKHSTWTEARLPEGEYTIITPIGNGQYQSADIQGAELVGKALDINDVVERNNGQGTKRPFEFINHEVRNKYDRFLIESKAGNIYTIKDIDTDLYLSIYNGTLAYTTDEYNFKFYKSSKHEGKVRIQAAKTEDNKPLILVYNSKDNKYEVRNTYEIEEENLDYSYHQFIKNTKEFRYKIVNNEIASLSPGKYSFVIVSDLRNNNDKRSMDSNRVNTWFLNSTSLKLEGNYYYLNNQNEVPTMWTFTKRADGGFNIQDENENYARIIKRSDKDWYYTDLVDKDSAAPDTNEYIFDFLENHYLRSRANNYEFNLDGGGTTWHTWTRTGNNKINLAAMDIVKDPAPSEVDLVEAIISDGDYFIANETAEYGLENRRWKSYLDSDKSVDENNKLKQRNGNQLGTINIFHIKREADGTYRITEYNKPSDFLQITNQQYNQYEYKKIYLKSGIEQIGSEKIKIATTKETPNLFYIYNDFGSLQFYPWEGHNQFAASKVGGLGKPLRLYKVNNSNGDNKRFTHQENVPTEKFANIPDGDYIIGNSSKIESDFEGSTESNHESFDNKQIINTLPNKPKEESNVKAWIHYNEKATNDNTEHHTIEEKDNKTLTEWEFIQTEQPGHYYIKRKGKEAYLRLYTGDINVSTTKEKVNIYKDEERVDQVLITQGNYRLRFDGTKWIAISNTAPLTNEDYHYIGKKITDYLYFKLTNPDGTVIDTDNIIANPENKWDNNVRLMEKVWTENMGGKLTYNLPKGYYKELGPIGKLYERQNPGENNPYKDLYRISQDEAGIPEELKDNHYKEYAFIGWEFNQEGKTYLIDKDAEFTKKEDGIEILGNKVTVNGIEQTESLFIPFGNTNPLKTKWLEVSAPLYFYFNYGKGIMDIERIMSVGEILARENSSDTSPIFAAGRLLYGQDFTEAKDKNSSVTMDKKIKDKFVNKNSVSFAEKLYALKENEINQIYFEKIGKVNSPHDNVIYEDSPFSITPRLVKERGIDWVRESDTVLGILKKPKEGDTGNDIVFQPDKDNIKIENYNMDYVWLDRKEDGSFLHGIVYAKTSELVIEKHFKNMTTPEFENIIIPHETSYGKNERFQVDILVDEERASGTTGDREYDDILYTLIATRTPTGNTVADSPYPNVGAPPKTYNEIERVNTFVDRTNMTIRWGVRSLGGEQFVLHEKGVDFKDNTKKPNLYVRIEEYDKNKPNPVETIGTYEYGQQDKDNIKTNVLTLGINNIVRFSNLYSSGGVVLLTKYDKDTNELLKGIEFQLYKKEGEQYVQQYTKETFITSENGTTTFKDLKAGDYMLKEILPTDSIYKKMEDYTFQVSLQTIDGKQYYTISSTENREDIQIVPSTGETSSNAINVYNSTKSGAFTVEKNFVDIDFEEYNTILESGNFKITVDGVKDGKQYSKELTYSNVSASTFTKKLIWKFDTLEPVDGQGASLSAIDMEELYLSEEGYEHQHYPVVKRNASFNGEDKDFIEYPYKILASEILKGEDDKNIFKFDNIYTDTFEIIINAKGRSKEFSDYKKILGMEFEIYGGLDEATTDTQGTDFDGIRLFRLDKPEIEGGSPVKKFVTDENGNARILKLVFYEGTKYALVQSKNPGDSDTNQGVIYNPITEPFMIELKMEDGVLKPVILTNTSVKGKWISKYEAGRLIIKLELDRTNYRLPETGGIGIDLVKKVAVLLIVASATLLIYKNKKRKNYYLKGER